MGKVIVEKGHIERIGPNPKQEEGLKIPKWIS